MNKVTEELFFSKPSFMIHEIFPAFLGNYKKHNSFSNNCKKFKKKISMT